MPNIIRVTAAVMVNDGMMLIAKRKPTARLPNLWERPGGTADLKIFSQTQPLRTGFNLAELRWCFLSQGSGLSGVGVRVQFNAL